MGSNRASSTLIFSSYQFLQGFRDLSLIHFIQQVDLSNSQVQMNFLRSSWLLVVVKNLMFQRLFRVLLPLFWVQGVVMTKYLVKIILFLELIILLKLPQLPQPPFSFEPYTLITIPKILLGRLHCTFRNKCFCIFRHHKAPLLAQFLLFQLSSNSQDNHSHRNLPSSPYFPSKYSSLIRQINPLSPCLFNINYSDISF